MLGRVPRFMIYVKCNGCSSRYCAAAAELGDAIGQVNLGDLYYYGAGVKKDWATTFTLCVLALVLVFKCSPDAQPRDGRYTKAAEQGNAQAQNSLAYCYRYGHGVKADKAEAVRL